MTPELCPRCNRNVTYSKLCAECAEKRIAELETAVERATANMVHAQNYAAELEKGLQEIVDSICCDVEDMGVKPTQCAHCIAKKYLEGK